MSAQDIFVQAVRSGDWSAAADRLNGSAMFDILPVLAALGAAGPTAVTNISGVLRSRGWVGSAQRIEWAGEVVRARKLPDPPPPGLPSDQIDDARRFLARGSGSSAKPGAASAPFTIDMSGPFRSGWRGGMGGPNSGGHTPPQWYIQYGMDLGVETGTKIFAAFKGHVTKFQPHTPKSDTSKVYGAQLFMRSDNDKMGAFYTHFTDGPSFALGKTIERGDYLGRTLRDHLHLALVEIIGGAPNGRYMGVDIYRHFLSMADTSKAVSVVFNQNGSQPFVT